MEKILYTVYRITNKINDNTYVGVHKTTDPNDGYMGSGTVIRRAIEKYGIENFEKEILYVFDNPEDMYKMESELVDSSFLTNENTYNLNIGGFGGFEYINLNGLRYVVSDHMNTDFFSECGRKGAIES